MRYALLIHQDEERWQGLAEPDRAAIVRRYYELHDSLKAEGRFVDAGRLLPAAQARILRQGAAEVLVTDGPFADTKEQFAGYLIVEAPDVDSAAEIAKRIPSLEFGAVEVRPMMELPPEPSA
jgi:hypothetical protein